MGTMKVPSKVVGVVDIKACLLGQASKQVYFYNINFSAAGVGASRDILCWDR